MEKDLCLDVALRLGKIIQQKLPGADIVYTRSDDTFIPLEERTHIANEAKSDLFISIHANSSPDHGARGVETYYLNLRDRRKRWRWRRGRMRFPRKAFTTWKTW